ncbi:MAG: VWA domain-containing protein [Acidobacteria bacterium]|nr:VWA domain-containing protein [Acidobacteriota bacterium]
MRHLARSSRKGQVIVMVALMLGFIVSLASLAVDLVFAYSVKHYLGVAIDAVALSAMRGLSSGATFEEQGASMNRIANLMLATNFPNGFLMTQNVGFETPPTLYGLTIPTSAPAPFMTDPSLTPGVRELRVTGTATVPTFFARAFGVTSLTVRSSAIAARQDTNVMLVLDRSSSLASAGAWDDVQQAATTFLDFFDNNGDRVGLVSFGTGANVDVTLRSGFKDGNYAANQIALMESNGATNSALGLWLAYGELLRINDSDSLNVIVFFTDGQPTGMPGRWRVHTTGSPRNGDSNNPTCSSSYKEAVIQTFSGFSDLGGFNKYIAGPPKVQPASGWGADFYPVSGCQKLDTPYGNKVELLLNPASCLPSTWDAAYDASHGCVNCGGSTFNKTFDIVPGPYGGYSPCDSKMFSTTSSASFRGARWAESSRNLAESVAVTAGADESLGTITIYSLGLGVAGLTENEEFLLRVSNDDASPTFDPASRPEGEYIFAPTADELAAAFDRVRSNVIRLTR